MQLQRAHVAPQPGGISSGLLAPGYVPLLLLLLLLLLQLLLLLLLLQATQLLYRAQRPHRTGGVTRCARVRVAACTHVRTQRAQRAHARQRMGIHKHWQ
jgi:hypothetical protein